jgi:exopolyphosphatase / guanosine-5'-triphosphate,3'-diphosphate pyrophosphatase
VEVLGPASFEAVLLEKMMIQLGKTALVRGRLDQASMERGLQCLEEFRRMALARRVERTIAVATSAIREAENGKEFLHRAGARSGIAIRAISGPEEARLVHLAVTRHINLGAERALIVDIGGGSVELTVGNASRIYYAASEKLGFLRLHERFVSRDPMSKREERLLVDHIRNSLKIPFANIRKYKAGEVIATSGSATTLLRLAQLRRGEIPESAAASAHISREEIHAILAGMRRLRSVDAARKFDLDPLRSVYLPTSLLCLDTILEGIGATGLTVCEAALREGLIIDFLARSKPHTFVTRATPDLLSLLKNSEAVWEDIVNWR